MRRAILLAVAVLTSVCAYSETWNTTKTVCGQAFSKRPAPNASESHIPTQPEPAWRFHTLEECGIDFFTLDPIGPAMGNIGTGSGFGGGVHAKKAFGANHVLTFKALSSVNSSNLLNAEYRIFLPIRAIVIPDSNGHGGQTDETKGSVDFDITRFDLRTQDFYGLGQSSSLAGHAVYRHQEIWAGMNGYMPLRFLSGRAGIVGILGGMKYLRPEIKGVTGGTLPSVNQLYGEAGAPGSTVRSDFVEVSAGLSIRTPSSKPLLWEEHEGEIVYAHYFDQGSNHFSFDQLDASARVGLKLLKKPKTNGRWSQVDYNRPWWKDALCMQNTLGGCLIGTFTTTGRVTTSYTASGSSVPFYLQPTLGGADFNGVDTLRGLVDYRLRAPNRLLLQTDFDKPIANIKVKIKGRYEPVGQYGVYSFFDAGNVAATPGQLVANGLRTDAGVGFSLSIQNKVVFRVYMGFGAGEGSHPNAKGASLL